MSEPAADSAPPPETPPAAPVAEPRRRAGRPLVVAALVIVVVIGAVAASPFWVPEATRLLGGGESKQATAPDPALTAAKAEANRNAAAIQQLTQRLAALEARPAPDLAPLQQKLAALDAKPAPDLGPIQQQLAALAKTNAELGDKIAAFAKAEQAQAAADPKAAALALLLLQIREAIDIGRPFDAEYQALVALARGRPALAAAAQPLAGPAQSGVASRAALAERLRQLAPQIATAKPPATDSWRARLVARLSSLVTIRRVEGADQSPAEAAVGAAQRAVASGDLAGAVTALSGLDGANLAAAQPWLKTAKERLAAEDALRQLQAALAAALGGGAAAAGEGG